MASNKKSSLTGYLPDILMAAAAVRSHLPCASGLTLTSLAAPDRLLCHPQPARAARPRRPAKRRSSRQIRRRDPQTRCHPEQQAAEELRRIRQRRRRGRAQPAAAHAGPGAEQLRAEHCHGGGCARGNPRDV